MRRKKRRVAKLRGVRRKSRKRRRLKRRLHTRSSSRKEESLMDVGRFNVICDQKPFSY